MKKLFNRLIAVMLVAITMFTLVACTPDDDGSTVKGLSIKKDVHGGYVITKYVKDDENPLVDGELNIGTIITEAGLSGEFKIKAGAFDGNDDVKKLIVPDSVTEIAKGAFRNMKALETLEVPFVGKNANADAFYNQTGSSANKAVDSERTLAHFFASDEYDQGVVVVIANVSVYVPATFNKVIVNATKGHNVIPVGGTAVESYSIPYQAFMGATNLTSVELKGAKLFEIGEEAFSGCLGLKQITIPNTVKTIYKNAFNGCTSLHTVTVEATAVELKEGAFSGCTAMNKFAATDNKTVDLSKFSAIDVNALDFGRKVQFIVSNNGSFDLEAIFGDTDYAALV